MKAFIKRIVVTLLAFEARLVLKKYKPRIVAITGSVGKTSAKDAIATVLATRFSVRKSEKSFNSEIGVPLTILGCPTAWGSAWGWMHNLLRGAELILFKNNYPAVLVLEVGAGKPGDIKWLTSWMKPDVAVMTFVGTVPVHVEFFASPEALLKEKSNLISAIKKSGHAVLIGDDPLVAALKESCHVPVTLFGFNKNMTIRGSHLQIQYKKDTPAGITFKVDVEGSNVPVQVQGVFGIQHAYAALAALSVGMQFGINVVDAAQSLLSWELAPGRFRLIEGIKNTIILDDTYNASPAALEAALYELKELKVAGRRIAALGDMLELGKYAVPEHKRLGAFAGSICDILIVVGVRARYFAEGALDGGISEKNIFQMDDARQAGLYLQNILKENDVVLVKGSQMVRMERVVEEIMAHPEDKSKLLVRQDEEWGRR
ncbi:MAG: UDP-N-acetylmuramoyl-tripeptide--D-alanyl-D-alanine ligase [Minisyncoccota bacterium]